MAAHYTFLAGHHCAVALSKLLTLRMSASVTKQYNLVPAKEGDLFGWESNREPGGK